MPRKKLNLCTVCGRCARIWQTYEGKFCAQCIGCGTSRTTEQYYTPDEAVQAWNDWNTPKGEEK